MQLKFHFELSEAMPILITSCDKALRDIPDDLSDYIVFMRRFHALCVLGES